MGSDSFVSPEPPPIARDVFGINVLFQFDRMFNVQAIGEHGPYLRSAESFDRWIVNGTLWGATRLDLCEAEIAFMDMKDDKPRRLPTAIPGDEAVNVAILDRYIPDIEVRQVPDDSLGIPAGSLIRNYKAYFRIVKDESLVSHSKA